MRNAEPFLVCPVQNGGFLSAKQPEGRDINNFVISNNIGAFLLISKAILFKSKHATIRCSQLTMFPRDCPYYISHVVVCRLSLDGSLLFFLKKKQTNIIFKNMVTNCSWIGRSNRCGGAGHSGHYRPRRLDALPAEEEQEPRDDRWTHERSSSSGRSSSVRHQHGNGCPTSRSVDLSLQRVVCLSFPNDRLVPFSL